MKKLLIFFVALIVLFAFVATVSAEDQRLSDRVELLEERLAALEQSLEAKIQNGMATANAVLPDSSMRCTRTAQTATIAIHARLKEYPLDLVAISGGRFLAPLFYVPGDIFYIGTSDPNVKVLVGRLITRYYSNDNASKDVYGDVPIEAYFDGKNTVFCINFHPVNLETQTISYAYGTMVYIRPGAVIE